VKKKKKKPVNSLAMGVAKSTAVGTAKMAVSQFCFFSFISFISSLVENQLH
jgi:hypothetical protein